MRLEEILELVERDAALDGLGEVLVFVDFLQQLVAGGIADLELTGVLLVVDALGGDVALLAAERVHELEALLRL